MADNLVFEVIGDVPEIEVPVKVEFLDARFKSLGFTACWQRETAEDGQVIMQDVLAKESELQGIEFVQWQCEKIRERLIGVKGFPVQGGKKINVGIGSDYEITDWLDKVTTIRPYLTGLYKSMISSLADRNLFEGERRKN